LGGQLTPATVSVWAVDLAHRVIRVIDAKTPAGVRTVDIHDDLLDELAAYKQALGTS
jgi:hypothetical protein